MEQIGRLRAEEERLDRETEELEKTNSDTVEATGPTPNPQGWEAR